MHSTTTPWYLKGWVWDDDDEQVASIHLLTLMFHSVSTGTRPDKDVPPVRFDYISFKNFTDDYDETTKLTIQSIIILWNLNSNTLFSLNCCAVNFPFKLNFDIIDIRLEREEYRRITLIRIIVSVAATGNFCAWIIIRIILWLFWCTSVLADEGSFVSS